MALSPYFRKDKPRPLDADDHDIPPSQDSAKSTVRAALAALKNGDFSKAFKHLVGNGLAPPTERSFEALQSLFPTRDYALQLPSTQDVPQLNVELADVKKILFGESHHKKVSADAFGWSKALLALNRAAKSTPGKPAFHELLALFIQKVVNIQSLDDSMGPPPVVGFLSKLDSSLAPTRMIYLRKLRGTLLASPISIARLSPHQFFAGLSFQRLLNRSLSRK